MFTAETGWLVAAIVGAEAAFWVFLIAGLSARYLLRWRRVSTVLLLCVPAVDLVLLALVLADLSGGGDPSGVHGLAAVYLGVSVGFGRYIIGRVDGWFAYRFAGAPRPVKPPRGGPGRLRHEWRMWRCMMVAWLIAVPFLLLMRLMAGWDIPASFEELWADEPWSWIARLTIVNIAWFATGPAWAFFSGNTEPAEQRN